MTATSRSELMDFVGDSQVESKFFRNAEARAAVPARNGGPPSGLGCAMACGFPKTLSQAANFSAVNARASVGEKAIAQKWNSRCRAVQRSLAIRDAQTLGFRESSDGIAQSPTGIPIVGQDEKVVHVAHVPFHFERALDELVEVVQVEVGKELGGEVPDGNTRLEAHHQRLQERHEARVGNQTREFRREVLTVHRGKILCDVEPQSVRFTTHPAHGCFQGMTRAFTCTTGVSVVYEMAFQNGLENFSNGLVNHAIAKRGLMDNAAFGVADLLGFVGAPCVGAREETLLKLHAVSTHIHEKVGTSWRRGALA